MLVWCLSRPKQNVGRRDGTAVEDDQEEVIMMIFRILSAHSKMICVQRSPLPFCEDIAYGVCPDFML